MKRFLVVLLMLFVAFSMFAEDALVLPAGVMRLTLADSIINVDQYYDTDGEAQDLTGSELAFNNFGAALEFGITDTLTGAIQWAPGVNLTGSTEVSDKVVFTGLKDIFVGAKYQALKTDDMRLSFALGLQVPLDSYDGQAEYDAAIAGDDYRAVSQSDTESLGIGARLYFDYIFNDSFYINLYNQTKYFFGNTKDDADYGADTEWVYGMRYEFELEPHYIIKFATKSNVEIFAPVSYSFNGNDEVDGTELEYDTYTLTISPGVSVFMAESIPFQLSAEYMIPLMGQSDYVSKALILQAKLFYDFY